MKLKHIVTGLIASSLPLLVMAHPVAADTCNESYGTTTCQPSDLTINKQVAKPIASGSATQVFVENLSSNAGDTYGPGQEITFKLTIKNGSGETFDPVHVNDVFPAHINFVAGPGTYETSSRTLRFDLEKMIAGETRTVQIIGKVVDANQLPSGPSTFCEDNTANVSALNRNAQDKAQVCISTQTLGATTLPIAGFNDLAMLIPFAGVGLTGISLIKLGKKS